MESSSCHERLQFTTQESSRETKSPSFTASSRRDGRESLCKEIEMDEWEVDEEEAESYSAEKFTKDGKHFSHHHPLSRTMSCDEDEDDDDMCSICGLPILSSPSYTCTNACQFFLHKECALKLPPKFIHPTHRPDVLDKHTLYMIKRSSSPNFTYKCEDCEFEIHPWVAVGVEIKVEHKSHPLHPLVAVRKEISCECDACGKKQDGFFFSCQDCNFWIHQDCTLLPNIITLLNHPQPFILAYSLPLFQIQDDCLVCREPLLVRHNGIYFCPQSVEFAHITCGKDKCAASKTRLELIQLPDDEWDDTFPSLAIRRYKPLTIDDDDDELTIKKYHNHQLILTQLTTKPCHLACDLCTRPINRISSLFYKCDDCHFVTHRICADILRILNFFIPGLPRGRVVPELHRDLSKVFFNSVFHCNFCHRPCNGLCYYFHEVGVDLCIDLECMAAPSTVNHASHGQHLLFRTTRLWTATPLTCCPNDSLLYDVYRCIICDYCIHVSCAMLPKRIVYHEYHHHPLHLLFIATTSHDDFCEVCEKDIDVMYWMYGCDECKQWFHINCIASVGYLSKVKFGGTVNIPDSHIHPLILTRMLTLPSQRCGYCNQIIQGLVDEMALFCSHCHFWLHFSCARNSLALTTSNPLKLYSEIDDALIIRGIRQELDDEDLSDEDLDDD